MVNMWDYENYEGKIKITTTDHEEYVGTILDIEDIEEDDAYTDDCINIYCEDGPWGFFQYEIEKIELLD